jgi:hypothetical protein
MNSALLQRLQQLGTEELYLICEAVELELERRVALAEEFAESARRRANDRQQSYRRRNGAGAMPVRVIGIGRSSGVRRAA